MAEGGPVRPLRREGRDPSDLGRHPLILPALVGLAGSVLLLVASFVVGHAPAESELSRLPPLGALRVSPVATGVASAAVVVGGVMMIAAWLLLGALLPRLGTGALRATLRLAALWTAPLLVSVPLFSRDVYSYIGQGRVLGAGLSPYEHGPAVLSDWRSTGVDPLWAHNPAPYGPLFLAIERVIGGIDTTVGIEVAVLAARLVAVVGVVLMVACGLRIARRRRIDPVRAVWFLAASPLVIFNFVVAAHNDALMMGLLLAGMLAAIDSRPVLAVVLVTAAVAVKPIALLALPIVAIVHAEMRARRVDDRAPEGVAVDGSAGGVRGLRPPTRDPRVWAAWTASGIAAMGLLTLAGEVLGVGLGWISALSSPVSVVSWFMPFGLAAGAFGPLVDLLGGPGDAVEGGIKTAGILLGFAGAAWCILTKRTLSGEARLALAFACIVAMSPVVYPWYGLWVLVILAVVGIADGAAMSLAVSATVFLIGVNLLEPMAVVHTVASGWPRLIVVLIAVVGVLGVLAPGLQGLAGTDPFRALRAPRHQFSAARQPPA
ncbi:polyprenol phosphomannose-dependent alpha 1,6 mannosyltransferase MptB [Clavibacter michiganensis]|uniref:polyprenol phosphomannose-dependent alpha 1,6 mannosyltransferase MptB n=1 Tax=Clavibacter michiganensis TaxID=28447 RepID=UPI0005B96D8B|nr:polyprenol phosphomannose-dependent alpha 1,6 mannosyltransferase MptB [Clavibacter michiganensis]